MKDHLFFFASVSPRFVRRTNDYLFSNGTEPGSLDQSQTLTQAFGKVTYSSSRVQANASLLMTPQRSTGRLAGVQRHRRELCIVAARWPAMLSLPSAGFETDQNNVSGNVDIWLGRASFSDRPGRLLLRQLQGHRHSDDDQLHLPDDVDRRCRCSAQPAGCPIDTQNTPRADHQLRHDQARLRADSTTTSRSTPPARTIFKGGVGVRHTRQRRRRRLSGRLRLHLLEPGRCRGQRAAGAPGTYGYYESTTSATRGEVGANIASLYVQDTWTSMSAPDAESRRCARSTRRFRRSDRTSRRTPFEFGFGEKLAPRLGATLRRAAATARIKVSGSWGRYYDWIKYELRARLVRRRHLAHLLPLARHARHRQPEPEQHAGPDLWGSPTGLPRPARARSSRRPIPNIKPMYQDSTNVGVELPGEPDDRCRRALRAQQPGADDRGLQRPGQRRQRLPHRQPWRGHRAPSMPAAYPAAPRNVPDAEADPSVRRAGADGRAAASRRTGSPARTTRSAGCTATTRAWRTRTRSLRRRPASPPARRSSRAAASPVRQQLAARPGTSTSSCTIRTGTSTSSAGSRPTVRMSSKLYGAYTFPFGTQVGAFFYGGSGTPISTYVNSIDTRTGVRERPRRHGPHAGADADRSAGLARA